MVHAPESAVASLTTTHLGAAVTVEGRRGGEPHDLDLDNSGEARWNEFACFDALKRTQTMLLGGELWAETVFLQAPS